MSIIGEKYLVYPITENAKSICQVKQGVLVERMRQERKLPTTSFEYEIDPF